jgi:apolipoprotein N-acyltransferase
MLAFRGFCGKLRRLKNLWASPLVRSRYPLAIGAGLLLAFSFPKVGIAGFGWIAPGLMLAAALGKRGAESFRIGYVAGLVRYLVSLYWLLLIPYRWHGVPLGPAAGWLALGAFLALYPAVWVWLVSGSLRQAEESRIPSPKAENSPEGAVRGMADPAPVADGFGRAFPGSWTGRTAWALSGAAVWVALEMILAWLFGGFPWNLLGASQYRMTPLIQVASVTGVYGVSFLMVWVSLSLVSAGVMMLRRPTARSVWIGELFLPMIVVAVLFNVGFRQIRHEPATNRTLAVALVQPSIPQALIWDENNDEARFRDVIRLSDQALAKPADLLIWPESAVPSLIRYDTNIFDAVTNLAAAHHVWMIIGADDMEPRPGATDPKDRLFFNSSFLISPQGRLADRYLKRSLVIFGEYIPLQRWLPFLKWFTPIDGGFTPGRRPSRFKLADLDVETSVLICFEDVFPDLGRDATGTDTDFLVNITNDGWFEDSAAQWQHAATGVFRAVENGVPLIRCTNNGLTCWIDAHGRLREIFRDKTGGVYGAGFMTVEIPLPDPGRHHNQTFYNRHGDWFGGICVAIAGVMLVLRLTRTMKSFRRGNS